MRIEVVLRSGEGEAGMKFWSKIAALFASLSVGACATVQPAATGAGPALWEISDADTKIYLFGTIHLLPKGLNWRTPVLERAIAESDELVIETLIGDNPAAQGQTMMKLGTNTPGLPPLTERVPAESRDELSKVIAASGMPPAVLDRMETWVAALTLSAVSYRAMGLQADLGVEQGLSGDYKAKSRTISGLETVEEQLGYFDQLSEGAQRELLVSVLDDPAEAKKQFEAMLATWSRGDVAGIARTFDTEMKKTPELREVLLKGRNARWAQWLDDRMDRPGTVLVAVGAGHLAGSDSVQEMLRARGFQAKRLQ
jgi:uncharacterized protein YbaP (TraB family)